ncbi:purine and uridine phosphorylase, partial [Aureobasidium melanogenum]
MEKNLEETSLLTSRGSVTGDRLLTFDEIAFWQKDSPHIHTGYRPLTGSWSQSIKSIFRWHNETINIHSHSIGSIIFAIILPLHFYFALYRNVPAAQPADAAVFLMYFAGVASCFAVSAAFHTAGSHSQAVHKKYNRADCCGIVLLMWGASLASIHFAFICDARLKSIHWFLSSASATGCITFILGPLFIQPAYRNLRALTYLSLGLFAIVFILHGIYLHGFALQRRRLSLEWMGLMALLNFLGCAAYAFRIPESKFPGKFDFVLISLIENANIDQGLHDSVSGVLFLGCAHDERISKFRDRILLSLFLEYSERLWDFSSSRYGPVLEWAESITAKFRKLKLPFPIWTYYESVETEYRRDKKFWGRDKVYSKLLCPEETTKLQAVSCGIRTLAMNHLDVCDGLYRERENSEQFLNDLRTMVGALKMSKSMTSTEAVTTGEEAGRTSNTSAARDPESVMVTETHDRSTPSANDRLPKQTEKSHADNNSNGFSTSYSSQIRSLAPPMMDFKVGWICALPFETAAAEVMLDEQYQQLPFDSYDPTIYTLGRIESHNVVIACLPAGRPGTSAATAVARGMREKFRGIRFGFMVGIGGGVPSGRDDIRLGDVVVSSPHLDHGGVVQYDFGKAEEGGVFRRTGYLNSPPTFLLNVVNRVRTNHELGRRTYPSHMKRYARENTEEYTLPQNERDVLYNATCPHIGDLDCAECDTSQIIHRRGRITRNTTIRIHYGTIASGNQVIKDAQTRDRIVKDLGGQVLCFEMEAAGLMNDFPCLVIRGISDYCDSHKNDGWQKYAAASAAAYTRELLLSIPSEVIR